MFDSRMKSLAVRVLGEFGVDGVEPQALGSKKARLALQHLALGAGQVVPSDVLVDALWDHDAPARQHSLRLEEDGRGGKPDHARKGPALEGHDALIGTRRGDQPGRRDRCRLDVREQRTVHLAQPRPRFRIDGQLAHEAVVEAQRLHAVHYSGAIQPPKEP